MPRRLTGLEALDDMHGAATAGARRGEHVADGGFRRLKRGRRRHVEQFAHRGKVLRLHAARQQAVVTDAMEALRQHMEEEAADELGRVERHGLVPAGPLDPVVLDLERDAALVGADQAPVGDRDAVVYDLLMKVSADVMLTIAADPEHLGAKIAITSVLHT